MEEEEQEYRPRAHDPLVEPFFAGLPGAPAEPAEPTENGARLAETGVAGASGAGPTAARRGCGGASLLLAALAGGLWLALGAG
jgi:hypothetical protein